MLVFIDESGDAGFKIGSSTHFVYGMVIFRNDEDAKNTQKIIDELLKSLNIKPEFKFSNCSDTIRTQFFEAIKLCKFEMRFIIINKNNIHSHFLRNNPSKFYNYTLKQFITHSKLESAYIKIDGTAKREFQKAVKSYLCKDTNFKVVKEIQFKDSKKDSLIQLADMVTGAIAREYNKPDKNNQHIWKNMIKDKIINVWNFE